MLKVNLSIHMSEKINTAKLTSAAFKFIAVIAGCACVINPDFNRSTSTMKIWQRGALVRSATLYGNEAQF